MEVKKKERKKTTVRQAQYHHGAISELYKNFGNSLIRFVLQSKGVAQRCAFHHKNCRCALLST